LKRKMCRQICKKNIGLRKWAVDLLKYYSKVTLDEDTATKLINSETELPAVKNVVFPNSPGNPYGPVTVRVHTRNKDGLEVSGCEVLYAPLAFEDQPDHYTLFTRLGSPASEVLAPGNWVIWARSSSTGRDGPKKTVPVGLDGRNEEDIVIGAP
jgi:hypothetical protein